MERGGGKHRPQVPVANNPSSKELQAWLIISKSDSALHDDGWRCLVLVQAQATGTFKRHGRREFGSTSKVLAMHAPEN